MKKTLKKITAEYGRRGGKAIVRQRGKSYMQALGRKGAKARWGKK